MQPGLARAPLLVPLLVFSVILHAAVISYWPDDSATMTAPLPAAQLTVHVRTHGVDNGLLDTQHNATSQARAIPVAAALQQRHEPTQNSPATTRMTRHSRAKEVRPTKVTPNAARSATAINAGKSPAVAHTHVTATMTSTDGDVLRKQLNGSLQRALIAHFEYPPIARRRGWEGVVQVGVRVEADGQLSRLRLVATSGHTLLDRAALQSLGHVDRLKDSVDWLNGRHIDMILPVRYQLIDS
jgi:protein TonB